MSGMDYVKTTIGENKSLPLGSKGINLHQQLSPVRINLGL